MLEIAAPKPAATTAPPVAPSVAAAAAAAGPASDSLALSQPAPPWRNAAVAFNPVTAGLRAPGDAQQPVGYVSLRDRIAQARFTIPSYTPRPPGWPAASDAPAERPGLGQQQAAAAPPKDDDSAPPGPEVSPETPLQATPPEATPNQSGPGAPNDPEQPVNPLLGPSQGGSISPDRSSIMVPPSAAAVAEHALDPASGGQPLPGYKGGQTFLNDGRGGGQLLPETDNNGKAIAYKEWDANPLVPGSNRGQGRVVTGSDASAYYTTDHYKTFTRIR